MGRGKAPAVPWQWAASVPAQGHSAGSGRLPFQRRATARLVVHRYTSLRGIASPAASPRPQQNLSASFRAALPRSRRPCTSTPAAHCHLRRPCTSTPAAHCQGPAGAEWACFTWNVSAVMVGSAIVASATIRLCSWPACSLVIV